jgi:PleD family two-component response regulator
MGQLSGQNILIFDTPSSAACNLRAALIAAGATVHVVSSAKAALLLVHCKRIHAAFVASFPVLDTGELCRELRDLKIPQIFTGSNPTVGWPASKGVIELPNRHSQYALAY